jgi:hypothetical protein
VRVNLALAVVVAVVLASTALNLAIMYERLGPLYTQVEASTPGTPAAEALHARLTTVAQSELSRSLAMELSTVVLGIAVFTGIRRRYRKG